MGKFVKLALITVAGYILVQIISNFFKNSGRTPKMIQMTQKLPDYEDQDKFIQSVTNTISRLPETKETQ